VTFTVAPELRAFLENAARPLNRDSAMGSYPPSAALSSMLESVVPSGKGPFQPVTLTPAQAKLFVTAAIDMWLRGVQSFLVSSAIYKTSPIWSAVTGYYASHYSVRGLAHFLGHYQLHSRKKRIQVSLNNGTFVCTINAKQVDREHQYYWKLVHEHPTFASDVLFPTNEERPTWPTDSSHRTKANYGDHLPYFPQFAALELEQMKARARQIAAIALTAPPIPDRDKFPDLDSVHIVAYHRLVRFRQFLDEVLGATHRFWGVHRTPSWTQGILTFQITAQTGLLAPATT
jgi:hypothetical protein